jgi:hypothetical protein
VTIWIVLLQLHFTKRVKYSQNQEMQLWNVVMLIWFRNYLKNCSNDIIHMNRNVTIFNYLNYLIDINFLLLFRTSVIPIMN